MSLDPAYKCSPAPGRGPSPDSSRRPRLSASQAEPLDALRWPQLPFRRFLREANREGLGAWGPRGPWVTHTGLGEGGAGVGSFADG